MSAASGPLLPEEPEDDPTVFVDREPEPEPEEDPTVFVDRAPEPEEDPTVFVNRVPESVREPEEDPTILVDRAAVPETDQEDDPTVFVDRDPESDSEPSPEPELEPGVESSPDPVPDQVPDAAREPAPGAQLAEPAEASAAAESPSDRFSRGILEESEWPIRRVVQRRFGPEPPATDPGPAADRAGLVSTHGRDRRFRLITIAGFGASILVSVTGLTLLAFVVFA